MILRAALVATVLQLTLGSFSQEPGDQSRPQVPIAPRVLEGGAKATLGKNAIHVTLPLSGRSRWICVTAPDSTRPGVRRGSQAERPQVRPAEEPEKVRQSLAAARAKDRDQAFRERQLTDRELMSGQFETSQLGQRTLLIGGVAFDSVDNDDGVQVVEHSRSP